MNDTATTEIKIKNAAIYEFAHFGLAGARVDRIAKKAKINKAMIYYYFKSKEKLYESIISEAYQNFFHSLIEEAPKDLKPDQQMEFIIKKILTITSDLDILFFQLFFKEIAGGAKYIKKLVLQPFIIPIITTIQGLINKGNNDKIFRNTDPLYSFVPIVGSVLIFNLIRTIGKGTDMEKVIFSENYKEKFIEGIFDIYMNGILAKKEEK
jgi:AcrR family transcriptional regulator